MVGGTDADRGRVIPELAAGSSLRLTGFRRSWRESKRKRQKASWLRWVWFCSPLANYTKMVPLYMVPMYFISISRAHHDFCVCSFLLLPLESVETPLTVSHCKHPMVFTSCPAELGSWLGRKFAIMNQHWLAWKLSESFCDVLDCNSLLVQYFFLISLFSLLIASIFSLKCNISRKEQTNKNQQLFQPLLMSSGLKMHH